MGSVLSRCASRGSLDTSRLSERGERFLDKQPNWLVPPTWCRSERCPHQPVRYRTPTPYPKDDRKRTEEHGNTDTTVILGKTSVVDTPLVRHVDIAAARSPRRHTPTHPQKPRIHKPQSTPRISWEPPPRLNRFERVA
ncbi:uncharacterized protein B0T15DRAFT_217488 [Chaetomium strumarium]|uniref:Uncharacterized protein n=1 Tax=Chaetomium strumarium TaxID=1170767 RepID=A0AAJ0GUG2_9PEZI|nr:hypothetical protein B0T15DRAFT_217488 [Chaetomium strumarium]